MTSRRALRVGRPARLRKSQPQAVRHGEANIELRKGSAKAAQGSRVPAGDSRRRAAIRAVRASLRPIAALVTLLVAATLPGLVHAELSGRASVIDGDSIEVAGREIRLHGIDAPEFMQTCLAGGKSWRCGRRAARTLARRISGRRVVCTEKDRDRYGRIVARCRQGGEDLNAWLVANGWALAYRRHSRAYVDEEAAARAARRGIWRGEFVPPWEWRRSQRAQGKDFERCRIKGNISRKGERVYHVPGGRYYERTRIDLSKGERWFCSEAQARAAGWRRSSR